LPTVERIKWTSNRIIAISRSSAATFDTHKLYLKTDPNGILKIGGYQPTPGIWGIGSNILNHDDMWYPSSIIGTWAYSGYGSSGSNFSFSSYWVTRPEAEFGIIYVPRCSLAKIRHFPYSSYSANYTYGSWDVDYNYNCYGPLQYVQVNGKDTSTQFRWIANIRRGVIIVNGSGGTATISRGYVAPFLYSAEFLPEIRTGATGYYRFPAPPGYISSAWTARDAFGDKLLTTSGTKLIDIISTNSNGYIDSSPWCVLTKLNPVTLSVGLTP
jgi:hypothetical protein